MSERDGYPAGVPCWLDTSQPDPKAAADFYSGLFGWEMENVMPPDAPGEYHIGRIRGGDVAAAGSIPEGMPQMATWNTYVWVESADDTVKKVTDAGGSVLMEPFDIPGFGRMAVFADTEGAAFSVWQAAAHKGSQIVNEHGAVNFNDLHSRDVEAAKAFYNAVFGWGTLEMDGGFQAFTLAGYGDYLEGLNPGWREGFEQMGAPSDFADVVASLQAIPADQLDTPPHWGVTFAVDEADPIAAKAEELGGKVIVPPFDAPWVRMTVIADPQGATFVASKFVPENKDLGAPADAAVSAS